MSEAARQFKPEAALAGSVDAFWFHAVERAETGADARHTIVYPDGCADLIFHAREGNAGLECGRLFVSGPTIQAHDVEMRPGESFVGVRFRPGMSRVLIDTPPLDLHGRNPHAADLDRSFADLETQLCEACSLEDRMRLLQDAVRAGAQRARARSAPDRVRKAIAMLGATDAGVRVEAIAEAVGTPVRSLRRDVLAWTGVSPNKLARIFRLQAALAAVRTRPQHSLTSIAHESGYADHAHMTRDFRALVGATPSELRPQDAPRSGRIVQASV